MALFRQVVAGPFAASRSKQRHRIWCAGILRRVHALKLFLGSQEKGLARGSKRQRFRWNL
jgi:hypothetical protein